MTEVLDNLIAHADETQAFVQSIIDTGIEPFLVLRHDLTVRCANRAFYRTFAVSEPDTVDHSVFDLGNGQWDIPALHTLLEDILPSNSHFDDYEVDWEFPSIGRRSMLLNARKLYRPDNKTHTIVLAMRDVSDERAAAAALAEKHETLQRAYERERRITAALQRPLTLEVPEDAFPGLSVATLYSCTWVESEVGGDFFDAIPLVDGRVAFLVGDASGKGLAAAARATEVKDVLRAFLRVYPFYPALTLTRVNDYLCDIQTLDDRSQDTFVALSLMVVNLKRSEAVLAWAGIDPPLIARSDGTVEVVVGGGLPLGVNLHEGYVDTPVSFAPGDTIILATDGLTEARQGYDFFCQDGVIEIVKATCQARKPREMADAMLSGARSFAGGQLQDDACIVVVQRI
jgi:serine phosphatase RsbU (regulator of sigma subunit)